MPLTPSDGIASAAALTAANLRYKQGQEIIETDTGRVKIGDGATLFNDLPYLLTNPIIVSPDATQYQIVVADDGTLSAEAV